MRRLQADQGARRQTRGATGLGRSLSKEDVAEMRPLKPVPVSPPAAAVGPVDPPPDNKPPADTSMSNPLRGFFGR